MEILMLITPTIDSPPSSNQTRGASNRAWELLACLRHVSNDLRGGYAILGGAVREGGNTDELTPYFGAAGIYIIGRRDGINDSFVGELGVGDGSSTGEGRTVGNLEGSGEGRSVGNLEGSGEGRSVGRLEGEGRSVGRLEGSGEGRSVGRLEGSGEGRSVGNLEGLCSREGGSDGEGVSGVIR
eukprot:scaffold3199_cov54-Attheya_sp.AAC.5